MKEKASKALAACYERCKGAGFEKFAIDARQKAGATRDQAHTYWNEKVKGKTPKPVKKKAAKKKPAKPKPPKKKKAAKKRGRGR